MAVTDEIMLQGMCRCRSRRYDLGVMGGRPGGVSLSAEVQVWSQVTQNVYDFRKSVSACVADSQGVESNSLEAIAIMYSECFFVISLNFCHAC